MLPQTAVELRQFWARELPTPVAFIACEDVSCVDGSPPGSSV